MRSWLYRIATNVCLDMLAGRERRARPMDVGPARSPDGPIGEDSELLSRYVDAFERYDMGALTALIHEDATQSMPPYELWLEGRKDVLGWWVGPGAACRGSRVIPTAMANGAPAFGHLAEQYADVGIVEQRTRAREESREVAALERTPDGQGHDPRRRGDHRPAGSAEPTAPPGRTGPASGCDPVQRSSSVSLLVIGVPT